MRNTKIYQCGLSIVELMVALTIGLIILGAIAFVFLAQTRSYKTTNTQATIQSSENAIADILTPAIRVAGYLGCSDIVGSGTTSMLVPSGSAPLGTIMADTNPRMLMGYEGSSGSALSITPNAANDNNTGDWSPTLDTTLAGLVEYGSDVVVVLGPVPGSLPIDISNAVAGSKTVTLKNIPTNMTINAGQFAGISDGLKSIIFLIKGVTGNIISLASGSGPMTNSAAGLLNSYSDSSQFIPLQQTAFFVAQQPNGGQSALMTTTVNGNTWTTPQALVPGVDAMQVLYGIGANGIVKQYVQANAVTDWSQVYIVRLGFLIEGQIGSGGGVGTTTFTVLGTTVTVPLDTRLRHVYEMTISLRNAPPL